MEVIRPVIVPFPDKPELVSCNLYVVGKGPVVLIDAGPRIPGALRMIGSQLNEAGFGFEDIERILLTHGHVDHYGLVADIRISAGRPIPCHVHTEDRHLLKRESEPAWNRDMEDAMAAAGVPESKISGIRRRFEQLSSLALPVDDPLPLSHGDEFHGNGFFLRVIHTPGHSPGACCFLEEVSGTLFSGDTILAHITPNPLIPFSRPDLLKRGYRSLELFHQSIRKLLALRPHRVLTGHGEPVDDIVGLAASYEAHRLKRMERIYRIVSEGQKTLYDICRTLFGPLPDGEIFLAVSDVLAHLQPLLDKGTVVYGEEPGPPITYRVYS